MIMYIYLYTIFLKEAMKNTQFVKTHYERDILFNDIDDNYIFQFQDVKERLTDLEQWDE